MAAKLNVMPAAVRAQKNRLTALDGVRGICAIVVVLFHLQANGLIPSSVFLRQGGIFVGAFFVLSGFVITRVYGRGMGSLTDAAKFIARRLGRIWPLHAFVLFAMLLFRIGIHVQGAPVFSGDHSVGSLIASLLLVHAMGIYDYTVWNGPSWSISVEFFAYLTFACVFLLPRKAHFAVCAVIFLVAVAMLYFKNAGLTFNYRYSFIYCLAGFFCGASTCFVFERWGQCLQSAGAKFLSVLQVAVVGIIFFLVARPFQGSTQLLMSPVFAGLIFLLAEQKGVVADLLSKPVSERLGDWSYAIYMIHIPVLNIMRRAQQPLLKMSWFGAHLGLGDIGFVVLYGIVVLILAGLLYRYLEMPARKVVYGRLNNAVRIRSQANTSEERLPAS